MNQARSQLLVEDSIAFLSSEALEELLTHRTQLDPQAATGAIVALVIIWRGPENPDWLDREHRLEFYHWLNNLSLLTVAVADQPCEEAVLELMLMCDIRLGGPRLAFRFPKDLEPLGFDWEARCRLLMGQRGSRLHRLGLGNVTLDCVALCANHLVNQTVDLDGAEGRSGIRHYLTTLLGHKDPFQIQAILKCFRYYQKMELGADRAILLAEEAKQFRTLVMHNDFNAKGAG